MQLIFFPPKFTTKITPLYDPYHSTGEFFNYFPLKNTNIMAVIIEAQQTWLWLILKKKSLQNPEDFHLTSLPARDQWKWWRHFKLQAKMLSELIIRRDSVYTLWLTYLHLHCTNLSVQQISQLDLSVNLFYILILDFNSSTSTDWLTDWLHRVNRTLNIESRDLRCGR